MTAVEEVLEKALALGEGGQWEAMAEHLREAREEYEEDPRILCWLGVAEREMGMDGVAYERFKACLALQPEDPHILATAGSAVAAFDDPDAESALRAAAMIGRELPLARWMYGAYLARAGQIEEAMEELEAARSLAPEHPTVALETGVAYALDGKWDQAADELARSVRLAPQNGWGRILFGLVLAEIGRLEQAAGELEAGARHRPEDVEAQILAALTASAAGWPDLGYEMLERARQRGARGGDQALILEAEEHLEEGPEASESFLRRSLLPTLLRERLMTPP